jgi:hypothetical protein
VSTTYVFFTVYRDVPIGEPLDLELVLLGPVSRPPPWLRVPDKHRADDEPLRWSPQRSSALCSSRERLTSCPRPSQIIGFPLLVQMPVPNGLEFGGSLNHQPAGTEVQGFEP